MKTTAPHIYIYTLKSYLLLVSARSEGGEINKFSILGASFTSIVKNAHVLSQRCDIAYAGTASNLPPEIYVDHACLF